MTPTERDAIIDAAARRAVELVAEAAERAGSIHQKTRGEWSELLTHAAELRKALPAEERETRLPAPIPGVAPGTGAASGAQTGGVFAAAEARLAKEGPLMIRREGSYGVEVVPRKEPVPVPRGHCGRCHMCGGAMVGESSDAIGHCRRGYCAYRRAVEPLSHCAGCGAPYLDDPGLDVPPGAAELCERFGPHNRAAWTAADVEALVDDEMTQPPDRVEVVRDTPPPGASDEPPPMPERGAEAWRGDQIAIAYRAEFFGTAVECAEYHQRDAARWRARAELAESRVKELEAELEEARAANAAFRRVDELAARVGVLTDKVDAEAEGALPNAVREWRALSRDDRASIACAGWVPESTGDAADSLRASVIARAALGWLATAPAHDVARLALRGDALRAVRELSEFRLSADVLRERLAYEEDYDQLAGAIRRALSLLEKA